jgi:hypothetical protein
MSKWVPAGKQLQSSDFILIKFSSQALKPCIPWCKKIIGQEEGPTGLLSSIITQRLIKSLYLHRLSQYCQKENNTGSPLCMVEIPSPIYTGNRQPFNMMPADLCVGTGEYFENIFTAVAALDEIPGTLLAEVG